MKKSSMTSTDINQKLSNGYNDFSREVKKAAKYVLNNPAEIPLYSIRTIASNANVNPSTMVRLINLLGFERYAEFKSIYKQAASKLPVSNFASHAKHLLSEANDNPFVDSEASVYKALSGAFNDKTYESINKTVGHLIKAQKIYILGMRSSFSMAFYLHYLLHFILQNTELIRGQEGMLLSEIAQINPNDVVLVFGASPLSLETTKALDKIKKKKAYIIVTTDMYTSKATTNADIVIALGNETLNFLPSLLPYVAFSEILVSQLVAHGGKKMLNRIKKFEDELAEMGAYIRPDE
ncbi:MAG TPA: MurR/RpiR family transcriptional regulator [Candidatus Thioglobus sp.]|nr:MurR/RpiR family transcriptional regulator [Candidatus Thioglobus sp.]